MEKIKHALKTTIAFVREIFRTLYNWIAHKFNK